MRFENLMEHLPEIYTPADRGLVERAYRVAERAHAGQRRVSGEDYIHHCLAVADILAEMRVPPRWLLRQFYMTQSRIRMCRWLIFNEISATKLLTW